MAAQGALSATIQVSDVARRLLVISHGMGVVAQAEFESAGIRIPETVVRGYIRSISCVPVTNSTVLPPIGDTTLSSQSAVLWAERGGIRFAQAKLEINNTVSAISSVPKML